MDTQALKARSIELAERAYRQKGRAVDEHVREVLDAAAAELLQIDDTPRFFNAQSQLEKHSTWTEEQRALAHEVNTADLSLRDMHNFNIDVSMMFLRKWADSYAKSGNTEARQTGESIHRALEEIESQTTVSREQESFNYLISFVEVILEHGANHDEKLSEETVLMLRNLRDSLLSARELLYDEAELLKKIQEPDSQIKRLELAREAVEEIVTGIAPVQIPR